MRTDVISTDAAEICRRVDLRALAGKTILVTGASGLIGTYFLASLSALKTSGVPINVTAQIKSPPSAHTLEIVHRSRFELKQLDLATHSGIEGLPTADVIIHSAGYAQPLVFMANPTATFELNTTTTAALLKRLNPGGTLLFLSSTEVYNGIVGRPALEEDIGTTTPAHPRACYIEGKRGGETICRSYWNAGVRAVSARLAMIYGPGTRGGDKRALNSFIEQALTRGHIELMDDGAAVRTYAYVTDAIEVMWNIVLAGRFPVYNVGGRSTLTIAELASMVGRLSDARVSFAAMDSKVKGAPEEVRIDLSRSETEFSKSAYVGLEEGLIATIGWQSSLYEMAASGRPESGASSVSR